MIRCLPALLLCCAPAFAQGYTNYECGATAPVRLSPDGGAEVLATRTVAGMRQLPAAELEQIAPEGSAAERQSEL